MKTDTYVITLKDNRVLAVEANEVRYKNMEPVRPPRECAWVVQFHKQNEVVGIVWIDEIERMEVKS